VLVPALRAWARGRRFPRLRAGLKPEPEPAFDEPDQEFEIAGIEREEMIARLLADGWLPAGDCDSWDLERHHSRVLLATERFEMGVRRTLVRLWGDPQDFPK
jgi:hypothetical protein